MTKKAPRQWLANHIASNLSPYDRDHLGATKISYRVESILNKRRANGEITLRQYISTFTILTQVGVLMTNQALDEERTKVHRKSHRAFKYDPNTEITYGDWYQKVFTGELAWRRRPRITQEGRAGWISRNAIHKKWALKFESYYNTIKWLLPGGKGFKHW